MGCTSTDNNKQIAELRHLLEIALDHAREYPKGCLYCGEGTIIDGDTTPEHRAQCWYYQAEAALQRGRTRGGTG